MLDVGFGYGDQDFKWLRERQVAKVYGLNITPHHVEAAQRRAQEEGLADRTDFRLGSATELPFEDNTFDRVVALESAFHFYPRSAFFAEALRVLRRAACSPQPTSSRSAATSSARPSSPAR